MKFRRVWCYGVDQRSGKDDFVIAYKGANGETIEVIFAPLGNQVLGYKYGNRTFDKLTDAKLYAAER